MSSNIWWRKKSIEGVAAPPKTALVFQQGASKGTSKGRAPFCLLCLKASGSQSKERGKREQEEEKTEDGRNGPPISSFLLEIVPQL
jgi:hypothetical protein